MHLSPAAPPRTPHDSTPTGAHRLERGAFWATACVAAVAHWLPHYPPQIDLAQHAAQIRMLHDWSEPGFAYRGILERNFFTPYLPAYLLGYVFAFAVSALTAVKLVWTLGALGMVYASVRLRRLSRGTPAWDWLLIPGLFGVTFLWGLLTFQVAVPLGLFAVEGWFRYLDAPTTRRAAAMGLAFTLLFFAHALITAWVLTLCGWVMLAREPWRRGAVGRLVRRGWPLVMPIPVVLFWAGTLHDVQQASGGIRWDNNIYRVLHFTTQWLGLPGSPLAIAVGVLMIAVPFLAGARLRTEPALRAPLLLTLVILLTGPFYLLGNAWTYNRFFSLFATVLLIAIDGNTARGPRAWLRFALPPLAIGWTALFLVRIQAFDVEQQDFARILRQMEPGRATVGVIEAPRSDALGGEPAYLHFPVWYQVETGGLVEFNFATMYPMLVRFRRGYEPANQTRLGADTVAAWSRYLTRDFTYVLARRAAQSAPPELPASVAIVAHEGRWWLYARRTATK